MKTVDVGKEFYPKLIYRTPASGSYSAKEFRRTFLKDFETPEAWKKESPAGIRLDFSHVEAILPSFANEAFAFFARYADADEILRRIELVNISNLRRQLIKDEIQSAYGR